MNTEMFCFLLKMCEDDIVCDDEGDILIFVMTRMIFVFNDSMYIKK